MSDRTELGLEIEAALKEAVDWRKGDIDIENWEVPILTPERVKTIRKSVAKSLPEFERRFRIPARTVEGWEQGRRKPDVSASILLRVIELEPDVVEDALGKSV